MVSNQVLGARAAAGLFVTCVALAGCSHFRHHDAAPPPAPAAAASAPATSEATASPAPPEMTATEAALNAPAATPVSAPMSADTSGMLNPSAPMHYTVKKGDTLSAIAKAHYGDGNKYHVIFEANKPMLKDPNKIYPGQVLRIPPKP